MPDPLVVAWNTDKGVFIIADDPRFKQVRAAYDRLVLGAPPIVTWFEPAWRAALKRWFAASRLGRVLQAVFA